MVVGSAALVAWAAALLLLVAPRPAPVTRPGLRPTTTGRVVLAPVIRPPITRRSARPTGPDGLQIARAANDAGHGTDPGLSPVRAPAVLALVLDLARRWLARLTARETAAPPVAHDAAPSHLPAATIADLQAYRLPRGFAVDFTLRWPGEDQLGQLTIVTTPTGDRVTRFELGATHAG